ncbi:unnamed protein product [Sphagnum balticum]
MRSPSTSRRITSSNSPPGPATSRTAPVLPIISRKRARTPQLGLDLLQSRLPRQKDLPQTPRWSQTPLAPLRRSPQRRKQTRGPRSHWNQGDQMGSPAVGEAEADQKGQEGRRPQDQRQNHL